MPQIRGKQIENLGVDTAQLAVGAVTEGKLDSTLEASLIRVDASQAFGADQPMGGNKLTGLGTPSADDDAATKAYVDATAAGLDPKGSCRVITAAALPACTAAGSGVGKTLTADAVGVLTVDGVATILNDRVLVKNQVTGSDNGLYKVTTEGTAGVAFVLTRAVDADQDAEVTAGMFTFGEEGTTNADSGFVLTTNNPITVDTTALTFTQFSGAGQITAGDGLTKTGNTIDAVGGDGITASANSLDVDLKTNGGLKIDTAQMAVEPNDFAGTGLEDDGSDNLRLASQGNGIAGGGGTTLSVDVDSETGGNIAPVNLTANGVGLDIASIDGVGLEADGSAALRLAAQGNGITGGAGSTLSIDPDSESGGDTAPVTVGANGVGLDVTSLDGDHLDIDWTPTNYTPDSTPAEAADVDDLTAHLKGIDDEFGSIGGAGTPRQEPVTSENITGTDTALADALDNTPTSAVSVGLYLNGVLQEQGAGKDYTVVIGTGVITWLASTGTAVDMDTSDVLNAVYES